jgi:transposase
MTACSKLEGRLCLSLLSTQSRSPCPLCGTAATRIPSRYQRRLADLPCAGQPVRIQLKVAEIFWRSIHLPTKNLYGTISPLCCSQCSYDPTALSVAPDAWSGDCRPTGQRRHRSHGHPDHTLLRGIMALPAKPVGQVPQIGIDEFSFPGGRTFGTIIGDGQPHKVLDVLPARTADTSAAWMTTHPEIELVSRARGGD